MDYVTAACVVHRPVDGTLAWALAGHHAPLALGSGRELDPAGAGQPLGLDHDLDVTAATIPLSEDDGVLLYTDGILDARDEHGTRFSEERLSALVAEYSGTTAEGVVEHLRVALGTSHRPPATMSACSRRATTDRPIGGRRRRR